MKNSKILAKVICIILYLTLAALAVAFFLLPNVSMLYCLYASLPYWATLCFFAVGWGCALCMDLLFLRIMGTVRADTPFIFQNVRNLRSVAICCGVCALDFCFILFFRPSVTLALCGAILLFGCLCALVLGSVFERAVLYKEENDLTV